ncbi:MAG: aldo/keto reductase [Oscillospiraceae bacterium]|nr:aldo/keto reductase [Oscillospiraceae bacterium]
MRMITLGSTGITSPQNGFGALPIQRDTTDVAVHLLRKAYENGITFFDTARMYTDSEEKIGIAFGDMGIRDKIYIATKTAALTPEKFWEDLDTSLRLMKTDYIDIYQFHNPEKCFLPGDGTGMYECMLEAKAQGKIRHIGFTNHGLEAAHVCVDSGLYETLQFPFSYLTGEEELELVEKCRKANMGYIAMKGLAGGLITNSAAAYAFMLDYDNVMPIWGVQHEYELDEFLGHMVNEPIIDDEMRAEMAKDKEMLKGGFCRSCGYCMPCPAEINIRQAARMSLMIRRSPHEQFLTEDWQKEMAKIDNCISCGLCASRCPYKLDTPNLLKANYEDYKKIASGEINVSNY